MPKTRPFHTVEDESPSVFHNNSACARGQRIEEKHHEWGEGYDRRLCEMCEDLNQRGE